jgi:hypothetical protein
MEYRIIMQILTFCVSSSRVADQLFTLPDPWPEANDIAGWASRSPGSDEPYSGYKMQSTKQDLVLIYTIYYTTPVEAPRKHIIFEEINENSFDLWYHRTRWFLSC